MAKKDRWFLPTNTDNFKMMVAQGLITSPDGFSPEKYYQDELQNYPGFIPLFRNTIPGKTLKLIVSEQPGMIACLIEIDLSKITGTINTQKGDSVAIQEIQDDLILLPAPLPLSVIKQIIFASEKYKKELLNEQQLSSNFILADLKLQSSKADQKLFKANEQLDISGGNNDSKEHNNPLNIDYQKTYAFGGLLGNLFYFSKNGGLSNDIYKAFSTSDKQDSIKNADELCIYQYFYQNNGEGDLLYLMYQRLIEKTINGSDFKNNIIELLESNDWDEKLKKRTLELSQKLRDFENNDTSISNKFCMAEKSLERLLLMLFHRDSSEGLIDYQLDLFTEDDYVLFALLFGIRDKFIKIPEFIRAYQDLQNFLSFKMAEYAHSSNNSSIKFLDIKPPKTMQELLRTAKIKKQVVEKLALKTCVRTIISGDYKCEKGKNIYQGFIEPKYEIIEDEYFKTMSKKKIDAALYNQLERLK